MTPKEKKEELIAKFKPHADWYNDYGSAERQANEKHAIQCALITVKEILDLGYVPNEKSSFEVYKFYSEVGTELNKML